MYLWQKSKLYLGVCVAIEMDLTTYKYNTNWQFEHLNQHSNRHNKISAPIFNLCFAVQRKLIFQNPYRRKFLHMCDDNKYPEISNVMEIEGTFTINDL